MEDKKLYPFVFCTLQDDYSWGFEEFKLADLGYRDSLVREGWLAGNSLGEIMETYIERVVGENTYNHYGRQFPVCVKNITVSGKMPLRVHPDDETAAQRYDFLGKEKLWYVMHAGRNAKVMLGFRKDTDASEVYEKCLDNTIEDLLNVVAPHAGQCFHIAPGTPHCAEGDIRLVEISESSPMDFCMCGWGAAVSDDEFDPQLSLVEALDFIDYRKFSGATADSLPDVPQLHVKLIELGSTVKIQSEDSFSVFTCTGGEAAVRIQVLNAEAEYRIKCGETLLVPAECTEYALAAVQDGTRVLVSGTTIDEKDRYINPDAAPRLENEEYDGDEDITDEDTLI